MAYNTAGMDWAALRQQVPVWQQCAYLSNCSAGPISSGVAKAMGDYVEGYLMHGRYSDEHIVGAVREKVARLLGAKPSEIAFLQNTAMGVNVVATAFPFKEGDNVVVADYEFPANWYPWYNLRRKGVELRAVEQRPDGRLPYEALIAAADERTRVLAVSSVQFTNGFRADLERLGAFCAETNIHLSVDAFQSVGVMPHDVKRENIAFLQCAAHKWLLGPIGMAFVYVREDLIPSMHPAFVGHKSMVPLDDEAPHQFELASDAQRFEVGVHNYAGLFGFGAALDLTARIGVDAIWMRVKHLTDVLITGLRERQCEILSSLVPEERSPIVTFRSPRSDAAALVEKLRRENIRTTVRMNGVRVGPHWYNSEDEIQRLLSFV